MITHFYSDPHFFHKNIIGFCERPFADVKHMNSQLIALYNETVGPDDTVLWVGDCFFGKAENAKAVFEQLNGNRWLVRGNHDKAIGTMIDLGFDFVADEMFLKFGERIARVSHYPYAWTQEQKNRARKLGEYVDDRYPERRPPRVKGEVLIHGHTHSIKKFHENMVHVGVDAWDYRPVPWQDVADLVARI